MRFLSALKNDIRFQVKYGFYFLYAFFSAVYIGVLAMVPPAYRDAVAAIVILTDPAMLGIFFIGGIWLLERGEGLHRFWCASPLRPVEYVLSKAVSLAVLSTVSADLIALVSLGRGVHLAGLSLGVFAGAVVLNLIGLTVASRARSVNHYLTVVILPLTALTAPPVLTAFGFSHPLLEMVPSTALWRAIAGPIGLAQGAGGWLWGVLALWFGLALVWADRCVGDALRAEGGEGR